MSVLTSLSFLILSMLILAFLQLVPGLFALFSHYKSGQFSKNKASDLAVFFILGAETATILFFLAIYTIICSSPVLALVIDSDIFAWVVAGIFVALSILFFCIYYRRGSGSQLFISRHFASQCIHKAQAAKTRSDAFLVGLFAGIPELIFTLPLYFLSAISVMQLGATSFERAGLIILLAFSAILPLLILHGLSATGRNLADFAKFRSQNKPFFRFIIPLFYLFIAILMILGVLL